MRLLPGRPYPIGPSLDAGGVNFAVASRAAKRIELCLFASDAAKPEERIPLPVRTGDVWHGYLPGAGPGLEYGLRAHGPWDPARGARFDPAKLLVDPYARALCGEARFDECLSAAPGGLDTAPFVPRGLVVDPAFDWQGDAPPRTPWSRSMLYECHVKGMTALHPLVPEVERGRYLGLAAPAVVEHLQRLGVTAVSLLPVQHSCVDAHLGRLGLVNYWGYGTVGFFAPDARFASGDRGEQVYEFKEMVRRLHAAGIEVLLDVVYNHTPETDLRGATWFLRGLDNATYYRADPVRPGQYEDFTGCGNTLDGREPRVRKLVLDSLRYWVAEMHVDGFRFDLAPALARGADGAFDPSAPFFEIIAQDPVLAPVKLIAEPWDLGPGYDCSGAFPHGFAEWNGRFRDASRRFWRGDPGERANLSKRLAGSEELFAWNGRAPQASINFVTCHDGFTLRDLVSYARKHNEANRENNRDGRDHEHQWNCGVEGESEDLDVCRLRERAKRNLIGTLAFAQGVPMLSHGDELGRTQRGNNNAYCHDSELTWVDWEIDDEARDLLAFCQRAFELRRENPVFRRRRFFRGESLRSGARDVVWLGHDGKPLAEDDWNAPSLCLGMAIPAESADATDESGAALIARTVLLLQNGGAHDVQFPLPSPSTEDPPGVWRERLSSLEDCLDNTWSPTDPVALGSAFTVGQHYTLCGRSLVLLEWDAASNAAFRSGDLR